MPRLKLLVGYLLAFLIGIACRGLGIPLPAPTAMLGACIVMALTSGYLVCDWWLQKSQPGAEPDA